MARTLVSVGLCLWAGWVQAAPIAWTLDANMTRFRVPVATNTEFSLTNNPFQSDSLARSASGTLYSADPVGMIWDVTNGFQIPVGPTSRMMIGDLVMGVGGSTITGVAYEGATGDVYLSGNTGLNTDTLYVVPTSSGSATSVGPMANGDALSYFSDIEFDASGTLYAMSWYHRWFYTVSTANATTSLVSSGPHRDVTAMALTVPEPAAVAGFGLGGVALVWRL